MIHAFILAFSVIIIGPALWSPGGIVLLDYAMSSHPTFSWIAPFMLSLTNMFPVVFWHDIGSKLFFLLTLLAAGYLGILIARLVISQVGMEKRWKTWLEYTGVAFLMMNPFAYERMMTQPGIYLGIVLLGYGIVFLFKNHEAYNLRNSILVGISFGLAWSMFPHAVFMIVLTYLVFLAFFARKIELWKLFVVSGGIILFLNLNWLAAPFFGTANSVSSIAGFGDDNIRAFLSNALPPFDPITTNLSLYGFWWERYRHFVLPGTINPNWWGAAIILIILVFIGCFIALRSLKTRRYGFAFLILSLVSLTLWVWKASPLTAPIIDFFYNHIPFFRGFREPQKWIGILLIGYGFFLLSLVAWFLEKWGKYPFARIGLVGSIFVLLSVWTPGMLFSFFGQLKTIEYPQEFETIRSELLNEEDTGATLALPWHLYMACPWTHGRIVASPFAAGSFSPAPIIQADNIEVGNVLYSNSRDQKSLAIETFIRDARHDFAPVKRLWVDKILLFKCADWNRYGWLDMVAGCKKSKETETSVLYTCE